jgi:hypothetical protein
LEARMDAQERRLGAGNHAPSDDRKEAPEKQSRQLLM